MGGGGVGGVAYMKVYMVADEMTILFIEIIDKFPYKTDRLLKLEIHSEILKTVPN